MDSTETVLPDGTREWRNAAGKPHREDGPAVVFPDGVQWWYRDGKLYRDGGPAWVTPNGTQKWYRNGLLLR